MTAIAALLTGAAPGDAVVLQAPGAAPPGFAALLAAARPDGTAEEPLLPEPAAVPAMAATPAPAKPPLTAAALWQVIDGEAPITLPSGAVDADETPALAPVIVEVAERSDEDAPEGSVPAALLLPALPERPVEATPAPASMPVEASAAAPPRRPRLGLFMAHVPRGPEPLGKPAAPEPAAPLQRGAALAAARRAPEPRAVAAAPVALPPAAALVAAIPPAADAPGPERNLVAPPAQAAPAVPAPASANPGAPAAAVAFVPAAPAAAPAPVAPMASPLLPAAAAPRPRVSPAGLLMRDREPLAAPAMPAAPPPGPAAAAPPAAPAAAPAGAAAAASAPSPLVAEPVPAVSSDRFGDVRIGLEGDARDLKVSLAVSNGAPALLAAEAPRLAADLAAIGIRLQSLDVGSFAGGSANAGQQPRPGQPQGSTGPAAGPGSTAPRPARAAAADRYA